MPWAFVVGLFWVDFGETILDLSHFRKPLLCKDRLTSFTSFPKSGCGWKGLGWNALSFCCWFVLGRLWGNHFGPFTLQKTFTFSTLIRLLGEFSRVQVQGLGGAPRGEGKEGAHPANLLFCFVCFYSNARPMHSTRCVSHVFKNIYIPFTCSKMWLEYLSSSIPSWSHIIQYHEGLKWSKFQNLEGSNLVLRPF